jgi:hypothetical protein
MKWLLVVFGILSLLAAPAVRAQETQEDGGIDVHKHTIMRPDPETRWKWYQEYLNAPPSHIDPTLGSGGGGAPTTKPVPLLLDHITYTPSERNQSDCGNCWVWAGTALAETKHSVENGVKDRLSIQWFDSNFYGWYNPVDKGNEGSACNGGNLAGFVVFYNSHVFAPWSNKDAYFQDGSGSPTNGGPPNVAASKISGTPSYGGDIDSLVAHTIPTLNVDQATAISNIKNVLGQNKAVAFDFTLPTTKAWNEFNSFWDKKSESTTWDPDKYCGKNEDDGNGSHYVTIVGYDDSDSNPDKHYWIVLNSWGTTKSRGSGLFRMKMNMNYGCTETALDKNKNKTVYTNRSFENLETAGGKVPFYDTNRLFMSDIWASQGSVHDTISYTDKTAGGSWSSTWWGMGGDSDTTPALATFNTRQYMAAKGAGNGTISIWSVGPDGIWSSPTQLSGGTTDGAPALVTYRNKLYLFKKDAGKTTISYKYMNTSGTWSKWSTVPKSKTQHSPAAAVYNDQLHVLETGAGGQVCLNSMKTDGTWVGWIHLYGNMGNLITDAAPAATVFNNILYVVAKGAVQKSPAYSDKISFVVSAGDVRGPNWNTWSVINGANTAHGPMIGTGPDVNTLNVTIAGETTTNLYTQTYVQGQGWGTGWVQIPNMTSNAAPSLNTYWFSLTGDSMVEGLAAIEAGVAGASKELSHDK